MIKDTNYVWQRVYCMYFLYEAATRITDKSTINYWQNAYNSWQISLSYLDD